MPKVVASIPHRDGSRHVIEENDDGSHTVYENLPNQTTREIGTYGRDTFSLDQLIAKFSRSDDGMPDDLPDDRDQDNVDDRGQDDVDPMDRGDDDVPGGDAGDWDPHDDDTDGMNGDDDVPGDDIGPDLGPIGDNGDDFDGFDDRG